MVKIMAKMVSVMIVVCLVSTIPLVIAASLTMNSIKDSSTSRSHDALKDSTEKRLREESAAKAESLNMFFEKWYAITAGLREYWGFINRNYPLLETAYLYDYYPDKNHTGLPGYGYIHDEWGCYADFDMRTEGSPYFGPYYVSLCMNDTNMSNNISVALHKAMLFDPFFHAMYKDSNETLDLIWVVLMTGSISNAYPPYNYTEILTEDDTLLHSNETEEDYVVLLNETNDPAREIKWLSPYFDMIKKIWMVSCITPLYENDTFAGTAGIDILLGALTDAVMNYSIENNSYAFLIDSSGMPVALPEEGIKDFAWNETQRAVLRECLKPPAEQNWSEEMVETMQGIRLESSPDAGVASLMNNMTAGKTNLEIIEINGSRKIIAYAPVKRVGWSFGVVVPYEVVDKPSADLKESIEDSAGRTMLVFFVLILVFLAAAALLAIWNSNTITKPVVYLTSRAEEISMGKGLDKEIDVRSNDEIGELAKSFQRMVNAFKVQMAMLEEAEQGMQEQGKQGAPGEKKEESRGKVEGKVEEVEKEAKEKGNKKETGDRKNGENKKSRKD